MLLDTLAKELASGMTRFNAKVVSIQQSIDSSLTIVKLGDGTLIKVNVILNPNFWLPFEVVKLGSNSDKLPGSYATISLLKLKLNNYVCLECNNVTECWAPLETSFYRLWFSNDIWGIPVLLHFLPVSYGMGMRTGMPQISFDASPVLWE